MEKKYALKVVKMIFIIDMNIKILAIKNAQKIQKITIIYVRLSMMHPQ